MSAPFRFVFDFACDLDGSVRHFASETEPREIEIDNLYDNTTTIAASATAVLYDPTLTGVPATSNAWLLLVLISDTDNVEIELTCNEDDTNERQFSITLAQGVPFVLGDDASRFNYSVGSAGDSFGGTLDSIDRIRAKNLNSDTSVKVRVGIGS